MVCVNCASESQHTGSSTCKNYCTLCAQSGHRQKIGSCLYRVCNTCGATGHSARECPSKTIVNSSTEEAQMQHDRPSDEVCERCQEHGHDEAQCPEPRCKACGSSNHRNAGSFECPEHKCSKCKGALDPKGHNKNNCTQGGFQWESGSEEGAGEGDRLRSRCCTGGQHVPSPLPVMSPRRVYGRGPRGKAPSQPA